MLCMIPGSSELRTKLIRAARGLIETSEKGEPALTTRGVAGTAYLFPELCSSHCRGSGTSFSPA